jgi:hypothetical protein
MSQTTLDGLMTKRNDVSVKVDADVVAEAKMVAASRDMSLAEYLSELIRPLVRRDLERETTRRIQPPKGKEGKRAEGKG